MLFCMVSERVGIREALRVESIGSAQRVSGRLADVSAG